jgi:DMSO/TMAO reductase YedYZ molybdopterin-dependent catalytic subunit
MIKLLGILVVSISVLFSGCIGKEAEETYGNSTVQEPASSKLPEIEVHEYKDIILTPSSQQDKTGKPQNINKSTYNLEVTGLVSKELEMSYYDLLGLPAYTKVAQLFCDDGWSFTAKWTGFRLMDLINLSEPKSMAKNVNFYSSDGYVITLPLDYIKKNQILAAYGINDVTLTDDSGFPFQIVAEGMPGLYWSKWITRIDLA